MTKDNLPMSRVEFIALCAMMFATIAFSIDAMLPALPEIAAELSPGSHNTETLIVMSFVLGMGIGTFFTGPLSDRFGRKPVLISGAAIYTLCAFIGYKSQTLEWLLAARLFQGMGAAGPRIVTLAIVRDLFSGRDMARIMSFVMLVFILVPAAAPLLGQMIIDFSSWRGIFVAFMLFALASVLWLGIRLPEPLPVENRRPFSLSKLMAGLREMWGIPSVRTSILVQSLVMGSLFALIGSVQLVYDQTYNRAEEFPYWFAGIALASGSASILNAKLVMKLGMRFLVTTAVASKAICAVAMLICLAIPDLQTQFYAFALWQLTVFFSIGLTIGNLNALAMEPLGHMAGTAASVMGALATIFGVILAAPIGMAFDGTPLPLVLSIGVLAVVGFFLMLQMRRIEARETADA